MNALAGDRDNWLAAVPQGRTVGVHVPSIEGRWATSSAAGGDGPADPAPEVSIRTASDVAPEPVRWLWTEKVPKFPNIHYCVKNRGDKMAEMAEKPHFQLGNET